MTDKERLKSMLDRAKIEYSEDAETLTVVGGYQGFYSRFEFDPDGSLKEMGAYE